MSGRVWIPESSLTDCNTLPHTEKRKKAKIVRRTTPTVDIPIRCGKNDNEKIKSASQNYSTIEKNSYKKNSASLGLESGSSGLNTAARPHYNPEFCGWETDVGSRNVQTSSSTLKKSGAERGYLSTPADGCRSGIPSRACSRAVGRRNYFYEFKHISDTRDYITDYCSNYSYTALSLPKKIDSELGDDMESCVCRRDEGGRGLSGRSAVHRGGERYLHELASRLGVGGRNSVHKKQLCHLPQPTPPSFTKRNRVAANLLVSTQDERFTLQEHQESSNTTPIAPVEESSELASRVVSASQARPHTTAGSLELPTMTAKNNKTLSTTSVGKYFTINSRPPYSLGLGEEESAVDVSSHGSLGSGGTLEGTEEKMTNKPTASKVGASLVAKSSKSGQQPLVFDDSSRRERLLSQKAQALGLVSRDWTRISLSKRAVSDQAHTSLPQTKEETISYRHSLNTTSSDRDHSLRKGDKKDLTMSRLRSSCEKVTDRILRGKLDKLRSIYEPGSSKGDTGKQQTSRRQRCETRRPATRCNDVEYDQRDRGHRPEYLSRPSTKLGKKMRPAFQCEESQYWNEVPNGGHSQFQTRTGTCLRVDSLRSSTDPRPPQSNMDYRPPQNTKAYLKAQISSQYPPSHHTPLAAKIELSGGKRCNGVLNSQSPTHRLTAFSRKTRKRSLVETRTHYIYTTHN